MGEKKGLMAGSKRSQWVLVVLLITLLALPGVVRAAMWVGGELGGNFPRDMHGINLDTRYGTQTGGRLGVNPAVIGGVIIGYDFVNSGFGAYSWPEWMKYFSIATDLTFNRFDVKNQGIEFRRYSTFLPGSAKAKGYMVAWTFMVMAHYGFFPDSEVPTGRVNPYIGVGPAILFSGFDLSSLGVGSATSTNIALVTELGVRFMALTNVSLDVSLRYRYANPSYEYTDSNGSLTGIPGSTTNLTMDAISQFSFLCRANYHF